VRTGYGPTCECRPIADNLADRIICDRGDAGSEGERKVRMISGDCRLHAGDGDRLTESEGTAIV
jgi:hypothetical protein